MHTVFYFSYFTHTHTHTSQIKSFLQPPMQGVILQTYGSGNVPDTGRYTYLDELKEACDRGTVIVNCTQCNRGKVSSNYAGAIVSWRRSDVCTCKQAGKYDVDFNYIPV